MRKKIPINDSNDNKEQEEEKVNIEEAPVSVDLSREAMEALRKEDTPTEEE